MAAPATIHRTKHTTVKFGSPVRLHQQLHQPSHQSISSIPSTNPLDNDQRVTPYIRLVDNCYLKPIEVVPLSRQSTYRPNGSMILDLTRGFETLFKCLVFTLIYFGELVGCLRQKSVSSGPSFAPDPDVFIVTLDWMNLSYIEDR